MDNDTNLNIIYHMLFSNPENGGLMFVENINNVEGCIEFITTNLDKTKRFKHTIKTEEIA